MAIKISLSKLMPKRFAGVNDFLKLANWGVFIAVTAYVVYLGIFLYGNFVKSVYLPEAVDASQIIAKRDSVKKATLDAVLQADIQRRESATIKPMTNPFAE